MDNIQYCVQTVIDDDVPGDLIEAGVWRGGACIFMKANLVARGDTEPVGLGGRLLPGPAAAQRSAVPGRHAATTCTPAAASASGRTRCATTSSATGCSTTGSSSSSAGSRTPCPAAPIDALSVMRLDGDMYESTWQAIEALYPKLSPGGFCIIDDFGSHQSQAGQAVLDYRKANGIDEEIVDIDGFGAYWRRRYNPSCPSPRRSGRSACRPAGGSASSRGRTPRAARCARTWPPPAGAAGDGPPRPPAPPLVGRRLGGLEGRGQRDGAALALPPVGPAELARDRPAPGVRRSTGTAGPAAGSPRNDVRTAAYSLHSCSSTLSSSHQVRVGVSVPAARASPACSSRRRGSGTAAAVRPVEAIR